MRPDPLSAAVWTRLARALALGRKPNYVLAFVTGRCDMGCGFCCCASRSARGNEEMTPAHWGRALSGADALIHLSITGGEPFLREDLVEVIAAMVDSCGVPRVSINTNGLLTDRIVAVVEALTERLDGVELCLCVSLDGPERVHDEVRGRPGSFAAARRTIDRVSGLRDERTGFSVRVASLLQPGNADSLEAFLDEAESWPVDFHEVILVRDTPIGVQEALADVYARLTLRQIDRAAPRYRRGLEWRVFRMVRRSVLDYVRERKAGPCPAGGRMVEVLPDGRVLGCELEKMWGRSGIGDVRESGMRLVDVVRSDGAAAFRELAGECECAFECAAACSAVFRPSRWMGLI